MTKKNLTIIIAITVIGIISGVFLFVSCIPIPTASEEEMSVLKLSNYPRVFSKDVMIVVEEKVSETEKESAQLISESLENSTGIKPQILTDTGIIDADLSNYNLILVGTPESNKLLNTVYDMTDATRVTKEYPGKNRGLLQMLNNPWNSGKALLIVTGSDEWGVKAGSEILEYVQDLDRSNVLVEWKISKPIFPRTIPADKYVFIEIKERIKIEPPTPHLMINRYSLIYYFDETSGSLKIRGMGGLSVKDKFITNDGLVVLIGNTIVIEKGTGSGRGIMPPVYTIPFSSQKEPLDFLKIVYLEYNGTVYLKCKDKKVVLEHGEEYETSFREDEAIHTITIKNYGLLDKDKIIIE